MKYAVPIARVLLGAVFLVFGLNHFLKFIPMDQQPVQPTPAEQFGGALASSGYLNVVKVLEVTGGLLLVTGLFPRLGIIILTPIIVNIL